MEINQAIKMIEDNFRTNHSDKMQLLGMVQELQQYRDNPLLPVQATSERQITVSQEEMEYIQQLEQAAQSVIEVYKDPNYCGGFPTVTRMRRALDKLSVALENGYE